MASRKIPQYVPPQPDPIPLTAQAYKQFQTELRALQKLRVEVMGRLKIAREMGDLSENGAYKYAKFELGNIGRRSRELRFLLDNGVVTAKSTGSVAGFGSQITLKHVTTGKLLQFTLVSEYESDPARGKLSTKSPVGSAVFGRSAGESIRVELPTGESEYMIETIS